MDVNGGLLIDGELVISLVSMEALTRPVSEMGGLSDGCILI